MIPCQLLTEYYELCNDTFKLVNSWMNWVIRYCLPQARTYPVELDVPYSDDQKKNTLT